MPEAPQLERKDIATAKITNLTSLINVDEKSKSSSFSLPRPNGTFRSVQRPNRRTTNDNNSSSSKTVEKPVAMTYADIMAKRRAEQQRKEEQKVVMAPPVPQAPPPAPVPLVHDGNQSDNNQDYQNTSDDAESIPISYQVKLVENLRHITSSSPGTVRISQAAQAQ